MGYPPHDHMVSKDFFIHESWNSYTLANDIALIKMPEPIDFTSKNLIVIDEHISQ